MNRSAQELVRTLLGESIVKRAKEWFTRRKDIDTLQNAFNSSIDAIADDALERLNWKHLPTGERRKRLLGHFYDIELERIRSGGTFYVKMADGRTRLNTQGHVYPGETVIPMDAAAEERAARALADSKVNHFLQFDPDLDHTFAPKNPKARYMYIH